MGVGTQMLSSEAWQPPLIKDYEFALGNHPSEQEHIWQVLFSFICPILSWTLCGGMTLLLVHLEFAEIPFPKLIAFSLDLRNPRWYGWRHQVLVIALNLKERLTRLILGCKPS